MSKSNDMSCSYLHAMQCYYLDKHILHNELYGQSFVVSCTKETFSTYHIACKQALRMGYSEICLRTARRWVREGEPAMVLVHFEFCFLSA